MRRILIGLALIALLLLYLVACSDQQTNKSHTFHARIIASFEELIFESEEQGQAGTLRPIYLLILQSKDKTSLFIQRGEQVSDIKSANEQYQQKLDATKTYLDGNHGVLGKVEYAFSKSFVNSREDLESLLELSGTQLSSFHNLREGIWPGNVSYTLEMKENEHREVSTKESFTVDDPKESQSLTFRQALEDFPDELTTQQIRDILGLLSDNPSFGVKDPVVTLYVFQDLACGMCARFYKQTKPRILQEFNDSVKIIFVESPLGFRAYEVKLAYAAKCASALGLFPAYLDAVYQPKEKGYKKEQVLDNLVTALEIDQQQFEKCMNSDATKEAVLNDYTVAQKLRVNGTPFIYVNGELIRGARPFSEFEAVIKRHLVSAPTAAP